MNSKFQQPRVRQQNQSFLVLNNIAKDSNFGFLLRTANAFGAVPIVVGRKRYSRGGAAAGTSRTPVFHFLTLDEGVDFVRKQDARILGIEIMPQARPVHHQPFAGPTAFVVGNEGEGLNDRQKAICEEFVYIPQYGNAVSLNINLATGIVLHHFALWAKYAESPREGEKFFLPPEEVVKQ